MDTQRLHIKCNHSKRDDERFGHRIALDEKRFHFQYAESEERVALEREDCKSQTQERMRMMLLMKAMMNKLAYKYRFSWLKKKIVFCSE